MESVIFVYTEKLHEFSTSECLALMAYLLQIGVSWFLRYVAVVLDFCLDILQYLTGLPFT